MPIPPEVAFDRYFRGLNLAQQKIYEGKYDLEQLAWPTQSAFVGATSALLNFALANERFVPEHRDHPPFHVDYIRSAEVNAMAFRHDGYSFIGLTIPLIEVARKLQSIVQFRRLAFCVRPEFDSRSVRSTGNSTP